MLFRTFLLIVSLFSFLPAMAGEMSHDKLSIEGAWARPLPPVTPNGAAYLVVMNHGRHADWIVGGSAGIADKIELHTHVHKDGLMKMQKLEQVAVAAGESVAFQPGGMHIMLIGLNKPLVEGDMFSLTLQFANAGEQQIVVHVADGPKAKSGHSGHKMSTQAE